MYRFRDRRYTCTELAPWRRGEHWRRRKGRADERRKCNTPPPPRSPNHHQLFAAFSLSRRIVSLSLSLFLSLFVRPSFLPPTISAAQSFAAQQLLLRNSRAQPLCLSHHFSSPPRSYIIIIIISARSFVRPRPRRSRFLLLLRLLLLRLLFRLYSRLRVARATWIIITIPPRPSVRNPREEGERERERGEKRGKRRKLLTHEEPARTIYNHNIIYASPCVREGRQARGRRCAAKVYML